jgi:hypothetical protein
MVASNEGILSSSSSRPNVKRRSSQELNEDIEREARPTKTAELESSSVPVADSVVSPIIHNLRSLCRIIEQHLKDAGDQVLTEPICVGKVSSLEVWDQYLEYDRPPLHPKY